MPNSVNRPIPDRVARRAAENYVEGPNGCHVSTYSTGSHGYAQIGWKDTDGRMVGTTAHRAAYVHAHGQIADGLTVDHRPECDRRCVNAEHLRTLTNYDNARRNAVGDWPLGDGECRHGHPADRLHRKPSGKRVCLDCRAEWQRRYRAKKRVNR